MDDKERILMTVIDRLASTALLGRRSSEIAGLIVDSEGEPMPQFVGNYIYKPKPGDIVRCVTGHASPWKLAVLVEARGDGNWLLREIGSDRLCKMGNEMVETLIGIAPSVFYTGHQRRLYDWGRGKAFLAPWNPKADYLVRGGGVEFEGETMRIWVRAHIFSQTRQAKDGPRLYAQPWSVDLPWSKRTRLKDIVAALLEAGFPREWEYTEEEPTQGMAGCTRFTRESLATSLKHVGIAVKDPGEAGRG